MIGKNIIKKEEITGVEVKETLEDSQKIIDELENKIGLRHKVAVHIVDLIPQDLSDLRLIFAKEPTQVSKEEMEQILEILNQYFPEE